MRNGVLVGVLAALLIAPATASAVNPVSFSEVGSLTVPREYPGAARLPDGRVLVVGGYDGGIYLKTADVFDPNTRTFSALGATMSHGRYGPGVASLPDGRVLIAGGYEGSDDTATAEVFNPSTGTFSPVGSITDKRNSLFAAPLPDGRVLVGGGYHSGTTFDDTQIFDPKTNAFSPGPTLPYPTYGSGAAVISGGRVLIAGGYDSATGEYLDKAVIFNPQTNSFTGSFRIPSRNYGPAVASMPGGRALLAGGYDDTATPRELKSAFTFDPAANSFSSGGIGSLVHVRYEASAAELSDGRVLVAGGYDNDAVKTAELLSVPSNSFKAKAKGRKVIFSVTTEGTAMTSDTSVKIATTAKKKKKKPKLVKTTSKKGGPGKIKIKVKLTPLGNARLAQKGKLNIRVAYTPDGGLAATKKLKLRAGK